MAMHNYIYIARLQDICTTEPFSNAVPSELLKSRRITRMSAMFSHIASYKDFFFKPE